MMMVQKETGIPFGEELSSVIDLPHTLTYAITYRARLNSFNELPKDKRPERNLWDKPFKLSEFMDHVWDKDSPNKNSKDYYDINLEEVE